MMSVSAEWRKIGSP